MVFIPVSLLEHIITVVPATLASIAALIGAWRNSRKIGEIHISLNSRLSQLLESTKVAAHAEGRQQERDITAAGTSPTVPVEPPKE